MFSIKKSRMASLPAISSGPLCFGEGQGYLPAERISALRINDLDLDQSYFFATAMDDMRIAGNGSVIQAAEPRIENCAKAAGANMIWPAGENMKVPRGRASRSHYIVRTIYATDSLIGSAIASLPIWALADRSASK